jgi:hypothetical protein
MAAQQSKLPSHGNTLNIFSESSDKDYYAEWQGKRLFEIPGASIKTE